MLHLGDVPASSTLYIPFQTYGSDGHSITLTGLILADIHIYKNMSVTQRTSTSGFTLADTDGIDFDGITGIHGFSIDLSNNTDAGFFSVGGFYWVVVGGTGSPGITVDGQAVSFIAATFRIVAAEASAGVPKVDVSHIAGSAVSTSSAQLGVNVVSLSSGAITAASIAADAITAAKVADGTIDAATFAAGAINAAAIAADAITDAKVASDVTIASVTGAVGSVTGNVGGNVTGSVGSMASGGITAASLAADCITAAKIATGAIDADALAADAVDEILDEQIGDGTITMRQALRVIIAACAGKVSGGGTTTVTIRNLADSANVVVATVDSDGNRSALTVVP